MNTIDNNFQTRWSCYGRTSWIKIDLGHEKNLCSVYIAWFKGDKRRYRFEISASTDGTNFLNVYSGTSSGINMPLYYEEYHFDCCNAKYVKIRILGNTQNNWASITEIEVYGSSKGKTINK